MGSKVYFCLPLSRDLENGSLGSSDSKRGHFSHFHVGIPSMLEPSQPTFLQYLKWTYPEPFNNASFGCGSVFSHIPLKNTAYIGEYLRFRYLNFLVTVCSISDWDVYWKNTEVWASNPCSYFFSHGFPVYTWNYYIDNQVSNEKKHSKIEMAHQLNKW